MTQDRTENSRAPPMRHHGFKMARRVSDTYKMCDCFILSCSKNVLIYRNIHFSKIYPRILKLQQKFTLFWIFPRTSNPESISECFVPSYSISDHFPVCFSRKINSKISKMNI